MNFPLLSEEIKVVLRTQIKRLLPRSLVAGLRKQVLSTKRKSLRRQKMQGTSHTSKSLQSDFARLGVDRNRDLFIHSSLSKLGLVCGGGTTILNAIQEYIGARTNLLMPVYPIVASTYAWMKDPTPFDVERSPSQMGALTELFRATSGAQRSSHPTHSVAVMGPDSLEYVGEHHLCKTPCGEGSPFKKLLERNGQILCLGTGIGKITAYHIIEDIVDFPFPVYLQGEMHKRVVFRDGKEDLVATKVHDSRLTPWRIDNFVPKQIEFLSHLRKAEALREGQVGDAWCHLIDVTKLLNLQLSLLVEGITIYHRPKLWFLDSPFKPAKVGNGKFPAG
jgi:aminoglycoside 3-N-acetyltransferase